jgi:hypothetical protein
MSNLSKMDNNIRVLYLAFETAPYALGKLMLQYLNRTKITLSDLINKHQHEIYHYFTVAKCCICTTTPSKCRSVIRTEQLMKLFDTSPNAKRVTGHNYGPLQRPMCCCLAKPIVVEELDFTNIVALAILKHTVLSQRLNTIPECGCPFCSNLTFKITFLF